MPRDRVLIVVLLLSGCGPDQPAFDASTAYTTESLAGEMAFRVKGLKAPAKAPGRAMQKAAPAKDQAKAAAKTAPDATLDDVLADTNRKAGQIPGKSQADALKAVAETVSRDTSLADSDRKLVVERLGAMAEGR